MKRKFERSIKAIQIEVMDQLVFGDEDTILIDQLVTENMHLRGLLKLHTDLTCDQAIQTELKRQEHLLQTNPAAVKVLSEEEQSLIIKEVIAKASRDLKQMAEERKNNIKTNQADKQTELITFQDDP